MKRFNNWVYGIIILALLIIIGSIYDLGLVRQDIRINTNEQMTIEVRGIEKEVNHWLEQNIDLLIMHQEKLGNITVEELTYSRTENKFVKINYQEHQVDAIYLGLEDGSFITGKNWIPPAGYDPRVRPWYIGAQKSSGIYIGDSYIDSDTKKMICTLSLPVRTIDNFNGVVAIDVYMNTVAQWMNELVSGTKFGIALIDSQGVIIHYTGDNYLAGKPVNDFPNSRIFKLYQHYLNSAAEHVEQLILTESEMVLFNRLNHSTWTIMIFSNDAVVLSTVDQKLMAHQLMGGILVVICMGMLLIVFRNNRQVEPKQSEAENQSINRVAAKSETRQEELQVESNVMVDPLTRSFSRQYGDEQLEKYWGMSLKDQSAIGMMLINLDYFKRYNDHYGHLLGNQQLINISKKLAKILQPNHILIRYGGDTFMILSYQSDQGEMETLATQLCHEIYDLGIAHQLSPYECITASIGVTSVVANQDETMGERMHQLYAALYEAKKTGRNRVALVK